MLHSEEVLDSQGNREKEEYKDKSWLCLSTHNGEELVSLDLVFQSHLQDWSKCGDECGVL